MLYAAVTGRDTPVFVRSSGSRHLDWLGIDYSKVDVSDFLDAKDVHAYNANVCLLRERLVFKVDRVRILNYLSSFRIMNGEDDL